MNFTLFTGFYGSFFISETGLFGLYLHVNNGDEFEFHRTNREMGTKAMVEWLQMSEVAGSIHSRLIGYIENSLFYLPWFY